VIGSSWRVTVCRAAGGNRDNLTGVNPSADHRGGPLPGGLITFSARSTSAGRAGPCCLQPVNTALLYATFFSASPSLMPSAYAIPLP